MIMSLLLMLLLLHKASERKTFSLSASGNIFSLFNKTIEWRAINTQRHVASSSFALARSRFLPL
jgi:hypothetical protein